MTARPNTSIAARMGILFSLFCSMIACSGGGQDPYRPIFVSAEGNKKLLLFGVPSPAYYETTDLFVKYLNARLDSVKVRTVACTCEDDYEAKLRKGYFDFVVINGFQLVTAEQSGYSVAGKIADEYRSLLVVNKDSAIRQFTDLKGRTICLAENNVLAGTVMPQLFLYHHGVDVNKEVRRLYTRSFESILLNVCLGKASLGAVGVSAYSNFCKKSPDLASRLTIRWVTPSLASSALLLRCDMDPHLAARLTGMIFHLQNDTRGKEALQQIGISRLEAADSSSYTSMKECLRKYKALIH